MRGETAAEPRVTEPVVDRLTATIGARITGVRLSDDADGSLAETVRAAVLDHRIAVLPGQFLEPEQQIALGLRLGPCMRIRGLQSDLPWPELLRIANPGKANATTELWHTDGVTQERPPSFSILAAHRLPPAGGDTLFVNMGHAYRTLSPVYRQMLRGLRARYRNKRLDADNPQDVAHPLVRTIPETGERVLYLGAARTVLDIAGTTPEESRSLLDFLFAHVAQPENMYRHRWQPGDVLVWDNRATMHYAVHDYGDEPRDLIRMTIEGERPFEAPYEDEAPIPPT